MQLVLVFLNCVCVLAVADASESHAARASLSLNFSRVSEVALGPFLGFLCYTFWARN